MLLPALDRVAVGVETEVEVELLSDPSEAVTTTTVVDVVGVALSVVEEADLSEVVWAGADVEVDSPVAVVVGEASFEVEVGEGAASDIVDEVVVGSAVVVASLVDVVDVDVVD